MTQAYPAEYERIYDFLEKTSDKYQYIKKWSLFYENAYQLLEDIETGLVYTLESNGNICGVFAFKDISTIRDEIHIPQLVSSAECLNYKLKYVMTCAVINRFAKDVYNDVMMYLENTQINRGYYPVYFDILNKVHVDQDQFIIMPLTINGIDTKVEFMPVSYIRESRFGHVKKLFEKEGYASIDDYEIEYFVEALLRYSYERDYASDDEMLKFLEKYPEMRFYFKPNNYEFYDVGFVTDSCKK